MGDGLFAVPQTNPHVPAESPVRKNGAFIGPVYERLETNIPHTLMEYSDSKFPPNLQLFPRHTDILAYLRQSAVSIIPSIQFGTQVKDILFQRSESNKDEWQVCTIHLRTGQASCTAYDAVVVASGHFAVPHIPDLPGLQAWNDRHPGTISHSKYFKKPESFKNQNVLVVGSSASGLDIASQISTESASVYLCARSESFLLRGFSRESKILQKSEISKFDYETRKVKFQDGTETKSIDSIIFCTGYLYSFPFLKSLVPNPIDDGSHVQHTYQHLIYAPNPTLAFLVLPQRIIPYLQMCPRRCLCADYCQVSTCRGTSWGARKNILWKTFHTKPPVNGSLGGENNRRDWRREEIPPSSIPKRCRSHKFFVRLGSPGTEKNRLGE
jgi:cation diffusion facilitator CzcD-associated flavoprotein CzcO